MVWRAWAGGSGLPVGALAVWSIAGPDAPLLALALGTLAGGLVLVVVTSAIARVHDDDPGRGSHLASAASFGLLAVPALGLALLRLPPSPPWLLAAVVVTLGVALGRASRVRGPAAGVGGRLLAAAALVVGAAVAVAGLEAATAAWRRTAPAGEMAAAIYDVDATVATQALPRCQAWPARVRVLLDRGARPTLTADGRFLWFDAPDAQGARQIHRLERESGEVTCWTCGQPGDNLRPAPAPGGRAVVFETDRHATWRAPANTEIHWLDVRGESPPRASRRLTFAAGPDDHAIFAPGTAALVWSRRNGAGYEVVSAGLSRAHGGLLLGTPRVLASGGARWIAPLAWSPDARSLVLLEGNPFRPLPARGLDLATGKSATFSEDGVSGGVAFNGDGGFAAALEARRVRIAGLLPDVLGFALGALRPDSHDGVFRDTGLRVGEVRGELSTVELGDVSHWGAPTGVALSPDGRTVILGQRRERGEPRERLLEIGLDCR
jgi:hypothetical protein